ncbi:hypothetical protein [Quadrisphaera sp. INWT6]|uniref:hypothetical protein n=1 Tax=Quadrisphaera sp. INWT6 TaxID=2596917 RepID=UPI0018920EAD|nr:hypothetical protein [Quadrisphaera sp. INWT6]MBF5082433.1 hypothetical protein [Quadrisphaera sp. INWT6]
MSSGQGEGRTTWWLVAGTGALLLAPLLTLPVVHDAWHWLGWWHWVVLALLLGLAGLGVVHLLPTGTDAVGGDAGRRQEEDREAVTAERSRLAPLPVQQLVLEVSRDLRRDGWEDAHVEPGEGGDELVHVRASRGSTSLVVGCRASGDGFVAAPAVRALAERVEGDPLATGRAAHHRGLHQQRDRHRRGARRGAPRRRGDGPLGAPRPLGLAGAPAGGPGPPRLSRPVSGCAAGGRRPR